MRLQTVAALAVVAISIAACGGGGGGSANGAVGVLPTARPTSTALPAGYAVAKVTMIIPKSSVVSSSTRRAQTIGTGTASITFTLLQQNGSTATGSAQSFGVTATSPGCATDSSTGNLTCILPLNAPVGSDVFLAQTYDSNGTLTGSGAVAFSVAQNAVNTASISLSGQIASVYLTASSPYLGAPATAVPAASHRTFGSTRLPTDVVPNGQPITSARIFVIALDSSGNLILNPSVFDHPVNLQVAYPYGGPADLLLQVQYAPGEAASGTASTNAPYGNLFVYSPSDIVTATLQAVNSGATFATVLGNVGSPLYPTPAPSTSPSPLPSPPTGVSFVTFDLFPPGSGNISVTDYQSNPVTSLQLLGTGSFNGYYYVSELGFSGTFMETDTCSGIASIYFYGTYFYLYGAAAGSCSMTISDGSNTLNFPIQVTTTSVTGS